MDSVDRFYLETVSGAVAGLFEPQGYDPALIDSSDRKYVDPLEFEAYIKSLPIQLCAPEFRNAYATIKNYANRIYSLLVAALPVLPGSAGSMLLPRSRD